ncbi:MAG: c-type cytochrome [Pyrinomonadaceae bacterium]
MKKISKTVFVLMFALFGAGAFSSGANTVLSAENSVAVDSVVSPKTLYIRNCARCHGADGKSETELGQTLEAADLTAKKTSVKRNIQVITNGDGEMPSFKKKMKKAEIVSLANYVRSL